MFCKKKNLPSLPLNPIQVRIPFYQWRLDFIREIFPHSNGQHQWILTTTDYFTKWVEAIPVWNATDTIVIRFIQDNIVSWFWIP